MSSLSDRRELIKKRHRKLLKGRDRMVSKAKAYVRGWHWGTFLETEFGASDIKAMIIATGGKWAAFARGRY